MAKAGGTHLCKSVLHLATVRNESPAHVINATTKMQLTVILEELSLEQKESCAVQKKSSSHHPHVPLVPTHTLHLHNGQKEAQDDW